MENNEHSEQRRRTAFVLLPFAGEFEDVYYFGILPVLHDCGYTAARVDDLSLTSRVLTAIVTQIVAADVVIADLSYKNPNVFYELGIAHSLGKPTILLSRKAEELPFDIRELRVIIYSRISDLNIALTEALRSLQSPGQDDFNPPSSVLQALPRADSISQAEFQKSQRELDRLRQELRVKEDEITSLKASKPEGRELVTIREEIKRELNQLADQVLSKASGQIVEAKVEVERLRRENEALHSAEQELRRLKQMTLVKPHWAGGDVQVENDLCFLLMPFRESWSNDLWKLIDHIVRECNYRCERADEKDGRVVMDDIWIGLRKARFVIADLTGKNPNVTYEVGLADVLGKEVILLSQTPNDVPFDFLGLRLITYEDSIGGVRKLSADLAKRIGRFEYSPLP